MLGTTTHALDYIGKGRTRFAVCGRDARHVGPRSAVTCKRCLASLAKRDREFRWKARGLFRAQHVQGASGAWYARGLTVSFPFLPACARRAIAHEEGRPC